MIHDDKDPSWAWDCYWHADRIASCMDGAGRSNYDERLAGGWHKFFEGLPDGSRIIDLCTGNGAIAAIAAEAGQAAGKHLAVTAVDLADIDPLKFASMHSDAARGIRFIGKVDCAELPWAEAAFDTVVSQYGIEYSDLERSLPEAVRVLAPAGRLRLGLHAAEGRVVGGARGMIADADFLMQETRLYDVADECLKAVLGAERAAGADGDMTQLARRRFDEFRQALSLTNDYLPRAVDRRMVQHSVSLLLHTFENRRHFDLEVLLGKVDELRTEVEAHRARSVAMVDAAVTRDGCAAIVDRLGELGMTDVMVGNQSDAEGLLGYVIEAVRSKH